jgi:type II secretory pathway component GspD/PulD (secretin)
MKTTIITLLTAICVSGLLIPALAQTITNTPDDNGNMTAPPDQSASPPNGADTGNAAAPDAATQDQNGAMNGSDATPAQTESAPAENQAVESTVILPTGNAPEAVPSAFVPPAQAMGANPNDLNLNFNRAPLDMVLNYLSDAAGFIVVQDTRVNGTVTVVGKHLTQDEAVDLLNTELNKNGYAATRIGRTLTIMDKNDAKTRNIPVRTGNIPESIPNNDEMVTQIIPIRFVEARQLVSDLSSFVSSQATIVANEAGNSIVVTDTQSNIRHLAEIIQAVDNSAEAETEIRVFRLKYASPTDVANELSSVFPSSTSGNNTQSPIQFRGGGGGGGRFGGGGFGGGRGGGLAALLGGGGSANSSQDDRIKKATQITAVADSRIQAVIVTAPKDLMDQIAGMMTDLDVPSDRDQDVSVISLQNGDPQQVVQVLQNMFQSSGTSRSGSSSSQSSTSPLQTRAQNSATTMGTTTTTTTTGGAGGTGYGGGGGRSF